MTSVWRLFLLVPIVACTQNYIVVSDHALYHMKSKKVVTFPLDSSFQFCDIVTLSDKEFQALINDKENLQK